MSELYQPRARRFDEVAASILARIQSGDLQPGDRLPPERKLVETYGVSRTAVREALRSLAAQGLIDSYVGRGTFVRSPSVGHLASELGLVLGPRATPEAVNEARTLLEAALVERAVHLGARADALAAAVETGDDAAYAEALCNAAGTPVLAPVLHALASVAGTRMATQASAQAVVKAVRDGSAELVRDAFDAPTPLAA